MYSKRIRTLVGIMLIMTLFLGTATVSMANFINLTLSPLSATNPVGTEHTVVVTYTGTEGSIPGGIPIYKPISNQSFKIEVIDGPNIGKSFIGVTDAFGQVTFTYADTLAGIDTIRAETSVGRDNGSEVILFSNNVTKEWFIPIEGFMTGGGSMFDIHGDRITHGFELQCNQTKSPNNLEVNWGGNKFHLEELTSARCSNTSIESNPPKAGFDTYKGSGKGRYNGVDNATASWKFTDAGEPGKDDTASIVIKDANNNTVLSVSGNIDKGNQQAHK
jgi:hypothetical protein